MDLLLILFGAVLSIGGGLLAQRQAQILQRQREEEDVLFEAMDVLLELHAILEFSPDSLPEAGADEIDQINRTREFDIAIIAPRLAKCAIKLKRSEHREIGVKLSKLALNPEQRSPENLYNVTRLVQTTLNPELIKRYELDIENQDSGF